MGARADIVQMHLDYLRAHNAPKYEPYEEPSRSWLGRLLNRLTRPDYVVNYVHPTGVRMPLTKEEHDVFVPIELELTGSIEGYRDLLAYRIKERRRSLSAGGAQ